MKIAYINFIMPSYPRYLIISDESTFHICWQCHNHDFLLKEKWTKKLYYNLLLAYKKKYKVKIYNYTFMSSHFHYTGHCEDAKLLSEFMKTVNSLFARFYNKEVKRRGQVIMDRFKSIDLQTERDLMQEMAYIDLNAVKARLVDHPSKWEYSSFHHYAYGKVDPLIDEPEWYLELGKNPKERQRKYLLIIEGEIIKKGFKINRSKRILFIGEANWVNKRTAIIKEYMRKLRLIRLLRNKNKRPPPIYNPYLSKNDKSIQIVLPF